MTNQPILTVIVGKLYKHGLKEFLLSESFEGILLDYDRFDVMWRNIEKRVIEESPVNVLVPEYTGYAEETMQRFLNTILFIKGQKITTIFGSTIDGAFKRK